MSEEKRSRLDLRESERKEIEKRTAIGAIVVHEAIRQEGQDELQRHPAALAWSGLAAGLSMSFSFIGKGLMLAYLPEATWQPLISNLGYAIGFLIVVLGRQQLFTENTLTAVLPLFRFRTLSCGLKVFRLWTIVLMTNLIGITLVALLLAYTDAVPVEVTPSLVAIGEDSIHLGFGTTFVKGIFAGWLIALMVWLLPAAESARVGIIVIITYLVGLGGFTHIIAGSTEVIYVALNGIGSPQSYVPVYMGATLLGNIVGGVGLVAALNYAQAMAGRPRKG